MDNSDLSDIAKNTLTLFCITINDLPSKTNINDFVHCVSFKQDELQNAGTSTI